MPKNISGSINRPSGLTPTEARIVAKMRTLSPVERKSAASLFDLVTLSFHAGTMAAAASTPVTSHTADWLIARAVEQARRDNPAATPDDLITRLTDRLRRAAGTAREAA
jgi:hypothetical protein